MTATAQPSKSGEVKYLECIQSDTRSLAAKLVASDDAEAVFCGLQLAESVADENLFVGFGMTSRTGDAFTGRGNLVGTSSRLDTFYLKKQAKAGRVDIERYLSAIELRTGERWRFLTLTMPKLKGYEFAAVMKVFDDAFKMLRDTRHFWKKKVRAGTKSKEFTLGDEWASEGRGWTLDDDGFHVHAHLIVASQWIENRKINQKTGEKYYRELAEEWKKALVKSARKNGVVLDFNTGDGLPIVDVRLIKNKATGEGEISLKDAIAETAKYITKQGVLENLPVEQVMSINRYLKGKRMIEPLGDANQRKGKSAPKSVPVETRIDDKEPMTFIETDDAATDTYVLYTKTIETFSHLKRVCLTLIERGETGEAEARIKRAFEKRRVYRKRQLARMYPAAEFMTLDGELFCFDDYEVCDFREKCSRPIMRADALSTAFGTERTGNNEIKLGFVQ
jgi:hypothetical protein